MKYSDNAHTKLKDQRSSKWTNLGNPTSGLAFSDDLTVTKTLSVLSYNTYSVTLHTKNLFTHLFLLQQGSDLNA